LLGRLWKTYGVDALDGWGRLLRAEAAPEPRILPVNRGRPIGQKTATASRSARHTLITGGAGFIGTNLADRICREGGRVMVYDNLSRPGVEMNAAWLKSTHGDRVQLECADVLDEQSLQAAVRGAQAVYHFAAQVAVTTSLEGPVQDFLTNARGTLNLLEAVRRQPDPPPLVFTSTNKVYGDLGDIDLALVDGRWGPKDPVLRRRGVDESRPLDFHSPYGCSKGSADQYVLDYARSFGLPACVFRMSCIYGPHQFGTEDQGWVAHFVRAALRGETITIYGDGRQVRDLLYVEDLVEALLLAVKRMTAVRGEAFNIGGGPGNARSLRDVIHAISRRIGRPIPLDQGTWRVGDQRYYVSNFGKFQRAVDWQPTVTPDQGIDELHDWLEEHVEPRRKREAVSLQR
jgi:CDP-paratose 2-epimerase